MAIWAASSETNLPKASINEGVEALEADFLWKEDEDVIGRIIEIFGGGFEELCLDDIEPHVSPTTKKRVAKRRDATTAGGYFFFFCVAVGTHLLRCRVHLSSVLLCVLTVFVALAVGV